MRKVRSTTSGGTSGNDTANRYTTSVTERVSSSGDSILRICHRRVPIAKIMPAFGDPGVSLSETQQGENEKTAERVALLRPKNPA
jgi:hypothetical protein